MNINSLKKDDLINSILNRISKLESQIYPVGSIYISLTDTKPEILFGGTWKQLKDRFLLGVGDTYAQEEIGGSLNHNHKYYVAQQKSKMVLANAKAVDYDSKKAQTITTTEYGYALNTNNKLGDGSAWNYNDGQTDMSEGTTSKTSNLPPYFTVYMWRRVS